MTKEELSKRIVAYMKKSKEENFEEFYISEQDTYENFIDLLSRKPSGPLTEIAEEIHTLGVYCDLRNEKNKEFYDECCQLVYDLNIYANNFEKDKDYDI